MNSPQACRTRLLQYLVPVIIISIAFNIPKFMEAEICWRLTANSTEVQRLLLDYNTTTSLNDDLSTTHGLVNQDDLFFPVCPGVEDADILLNYDDIWKRRVSSKKLIN